MDSFIINFKKTDKPLEAFQDAFNQQRPINVEVVKAGSTNLDNTESQKVFINSWTWNDHKRCVLIITAMFQQKFMIPGIYQMELERKEFSDSFQSDAYLMPIPAPIKGLAMKF